MFSSCRHELMPSRTLRVATTILGSVTPLSARLTPSSFGLHDEGLGRTASATRAPGRTDEPLQLILVEGHAHLVRVSGIAPELEAPRAARTPAGAPRDPAGRGRSSPDAGHARRPGRLAVELGRAPAIRHGCRQRLRGHAKGRGQSSSRWL